MEFRRDGNRENAGADSAPRVNAGQAGVEAVNAISQR